MDVDATALLVTVETLMDATDMSASAPSSY